MTFKDYARGHARVVDKLLVEYLQKRRKEIKSRIPQIVPFVDFFAQANDGGGRIRGVLTILGYQTTGGKKLREISKVAVAHELFQTSILVQDDIIDKSSVRRARPSLYQAISAWHKKQRMNGDALHFGISQAMNVSDIGFFLASDIIAQSRFKAENKIKAISAFNKVVSYTALGQVLDINITAQPGKKTEDDVLTIERFKTAQYTAIGPLTMGAYLAGAKQRLVNDLTDFGLNLGIAFQIQDDLKGVFGKEEEIGKSAKGDIEQGKITLIYIHAMKHATKVQKKTLNKFYGKEDLTDRQAETVRKVFIDSGARDYVIRKSSGYANKARAEVKKISKDPKIRDLYNSLCDHVLVFK